MRRSTGRWRTSKPGTISSCKNEINGLEYLMTQAARRGLRIVFNPSPIDVSISRLPLGGGMAADLQ